MPANKATSPLFDSSPFANALLQTMLVFINESRKGVLALNEEPLEMSEFEKLSKTKKTTFFLSKGTVDEYCRRVVKTESRADSEKYFFSSSEVW